MDMKKLIATVLTILSCGAAYALPLGNPSEASLLCDGLFMEGACYDFCQPGVAWCDSISLRFGYYGDFVFNRHLEGDETHFGSDIQDTEIYTNAGYLALNIFDRADLFATFGGTNFWLRANAVNFGGPSGEKFILETETDFSWSIGARVTFWQCGCTRFGLVGQYFETKPDVRRITIRDQVSIYPDPDFDLKYHEWQVGFGLSHRIWNLVPYFGAKISGVKVNFDNARTTLLLQTGSVQTPYLITLRDLHNRFEGGFVIGVSLVDCEKMTMTVEYRFPDEKALYVNGQIRF